MKSTAITAGVIVASLLGVPFQAHAQSDRSPKSIGGVGTTFVTSTRLAELSCLGLAAGDYTEAESLAAWAQVHLDGAGRLHVAARGTFAWAIYPYADDVAGPYDTQHSRLYFGTTDFNFRSIIDSYVPGSRWTYTIPSLAVSGVNGSLMLVSRTGEPTSILGLFFADSAVGHGGDIGGTEGHPVCPAAVP